MRSRTGAHAEGGLPGATDRLAVGWVLFPAPFHCSASVTLGPLLV
ncbi:MAG TPA: hypothetical protein VGJ54_04560 [Streptosporangiaceae bacterium]